MSSDGVAPFEDIDVRPDLCDAGVEEAQLTVGMQSYFTCLAAAWVIGEELLRPVIREGIVEIDDPIVCGHALSEDIAI